jgi:hypothetical protein
MKELIVELIHQAPGEFEIPSKNYKGMKYRTVYFIDKWEQAQIYEVDNKIISKWKQGSIHTISFGQSYCSLNLSRQHRKFVALYHNKEITKKDVLELLDEQLKKFI